MLYWFNVHFHLETLLLVEYTLRPYVKSTFLQGAGERLLNCNPGYQNKNSTHFEQAEHFERKCRVKWSEKKNMYIFVRRFIIFLTRSDICQKEKLLVVDKNG